MDRVKNYLKAASIRVGMYPQARKLYRAFNPSIRKQLVADQALYRTFIHPGALVFDVGANMGQKSKVFASLRARTIIVEPNPHCWKIIEDEIGKSASAQIVGKAVGAEDGEATLTFAHTASTASLDPNWTGLAYRSEPLQSVKVPVTTLDTLISEFGRPDFCKIDVEGLEYEVLKGLSAPIPVITLEFFVDQRERLADCLNLLAQLGQFETNLIAMNGEQLVLAQWVTASELLDFLGTPQAPRSGDIFIRFQASSL